MKRLLLVVTAVCATVLAGCGGSPPRAKAPGHPCVPSDFYMQCALPPAPVGIAPRATGGTYGVDFGWSGISATRARALGARFGASYFSTDSTKNWTAATVRAYHAAGMATVGVWETTATRAEGGYLAGLADAQAARSQAAAVGNTGRPILFAIDCDCAAGQILGYFQGVRHVLGARTDAYGGYNQIWSLSHAGLVGRENWQTYAWSSGGWLSKSVAPLEQYLNGSTFDNDRALAPAYGQWPYSAPKPKPVVKPEPLCFHRRMSVAACSAVKAKIAYYDRAAAASRKAIDSTNADLRVHACRRPYRRGRCIRDGRSAAVLAQRARFFTAAEAALAKAN